MILSADSKCTLKLSTFYLLFVCLFSYILFSQFNIFYSNIVIYSAPLSSAVMRGVEMKQR